MKHHTTLSLTMAQTDQYIVLLPEWVREYVDGEDDRCAKNYPVQCIDVDITFDDTTGEAYAKLDAFPGIKIRRNLFD